MATGIEGIAGHSLKSFTTEISGIKFSISEMLNSSVTLIDTPGFDDTNKSDVEILKMVSDWLVDRYVTIGLFLDLLSRNSQKQQLQEKNSVSWPALLP